MNDGVKGSKQRKGKGGEIANFGRYTYAKLPLFNQKNIK